MLRKGAPRVHGVPETCLVEVSGSQGEGKVGCRGGAAARPLNEEEARDDVSNRQ